MLRTRKEKYLCLLGLQKCLKEIADAVKDRSSPPKFVACQLEKTVTKVLDALRLYVEEGEVTLQTEWLETLPIVRADEQRLFNAFYNLVNNAVPEVPAGGSVQLKARLPQMKKMYSCRLRIRVVGCRLRCEMVFLARPQ